MDFAALRAGPTGGPLSVILDDIKFNSPEYLAYKHCEKTFLEPYFLWVERGITYRIFQGSINLPDIFYQTSEENTFLYGFIRQSNETFAEARYFDSPIVLSDNALHFLIGDNPDVVSVLIRSLDFSDGRIDFVLPVSIFVNCHEGTQV